MHRMLLLLWLEELVTGKSGDGPVMGHVISSVEDVSLDQRGSEKVSVTDKDETNRDEEITIVVPVLDVVTGAVNSADVVTQENTQVLAPNSIGSPPLSFAQIVRGSPPGSGSSSTTEQPMDSGKLPVSGSLTLSQPQGDNLASGVGKENRKPPDKGKKVWVNSPLIPLQPKKGKGGKGRGKK
ncbi:unnamed protein product [Linum trigynum]|uniref:Uncharacterized protein n=1 Tax=Linum trigynum TaxID=586398 RepID=A0AAV2EV57_9ROSI